MPQTTLERNSHWFAQQNHAKFAGQWVSIIDQKVVAHNEDLRAVIKATREKAPEKTPFITLVPEGYITV